MGTRMHAHRLIQCNLNRTATREKANRTEEEKRKKKKEKKRKEKKKQRREEEKGKKEKHNQPNSHTDSHTNKAKRDICEWSGVGWSGLNNLQMH